MAPPKLTSAHSARLTKFSGSTSANGCAWLAVGDAAMSFDPLSGQGLLRALQSGALAAEVIANRSAAALSQFNEKNETLWRQYAAGRLGYYAIERRWRGRGHEFWRRRHAGISQMQGMAALSS
jgi:flavin-dependent dehydrogenase